MSSSSPPGTLVIRSPCYSHIISPSSLSNVCDGCLTSPNIFDNLPPVSLFRCSKCKLSYYCNITCQSKAWPDHSKECKYLKNIQPRVPPAIVRLILRTCLKHKKQPDFSENLPDGSVRSFQDLKMHKQDISSSIDKNEAFSSFLQVMQACVGDLFSPEHLFETYCKILINSTEISDCMGTSVGTGLYLGMSAVDHSCTPNVNAVFSGTEVELRALETIPAPVFTNTRVSYNNSVLPTKLRQARLLEDYFFTCSCEMCNSQEKDMFCRGSTVCVGCKGPVGEMEGKCSGCEKVQEVDISKEKVFFFESLEDSQVLKAYQVLRSKIHIYDYKMVEFSERAMAVCLAEENYEKFYQIGESLLTAYKLYFSPNSTSLGLHLGKLAKVAIFLNQTEDAILYLKQCFDIFKLSHGEDSKMYQYLITIRDTT
eukprot:TRINITY_DN45983_c0_g1_i1.p1 TRINITY_DN45983_c0_g1~~TRINITY_DN45983_c0_g1_i1.p1  ORF type:complete len:452 (-),score=114.09 TRINITY_DN45983_c0_g1_i1:81-1355(-)